MLTKNYPKHGQSHNSVFLKLPIFSTHISIIFSSHPPCNGLSSDKNLIRNYEWARDLFGRTAEGLSAAKEELFIDFTVNGEIEV